MAKTHPSYTIDTTFTAKNISSAASVYQFTAAASAKVQFIVKLTNAAGSDDYVIYLKRQWLGAGTASTVLPKTTATAAAGETVIEFTSIEVNVKATDVVDVYIDGPAGDTSVNGNIRIVADNPSVFEATDTVSQVTEVTGNVGGDVAGNLTGDVFGDVQGNVDGTVTQVLFLPADVITGTSLAASAVTKIQAGLSTLTAAQVWSYATRTLTSLSALLSDLAAAVWAYATRTLTQSAASASSAVAGSTITITRADKYSGTLTGLGDNTGYVSIDWMIKENKEDADTAALVWVRKNASGVGDGLLYLNGAAATSAAGGSITVNSSTSLTLYLASGQTASLVPDDGLYYCIKYIFTADTDATTTTEGAANVDPGVARATS